MGDDWDGSLAFVDDLIVLLKVDIPCRKEKDSEVMGLGWAEGRVMSLGIS